MKLNWYKKTEDHSLTIPADILYLKHRWSTIYKNILIVGQSLKYNQVFANLSIKNIDVDAIKTQEDYKNIEHFDCILCYHSLSSLSYKECQMVLSKLAELLNRDGEIYLTILSKDSYFYKNKSKTENNLYVNQSDLEVLLQPFSLKDIEYTKRITSNNRPNPHYYILATKAGF